jgi:hypothetical protein
MTSTQATPNPYALAPLCIAQVDPTSGQHTRAFFFLGDVPKNTLEAANRYVRRGNDPRRVDWAPKDAAILRAYYGSRWRELLTAVDPPATDPLAATASAARPTPIRRFGTEVLGGAAFGAGRPIVGGALELDFGDLGEIDDLGEVDVAPSMEGLSGEGAGRSARAGVRIDVSATAAGSPVFSNMAVYPEDTIYDLRLKLQLVSNAAMYRAHLFYYVNEEGPSLPYQITVDGVPVLSDWHALARYTLSDGGPGLPSRHSTDASEATTSIAGIRVDPRLEERREGLRVIALDTFTTLAPAPNVRVTRAYFVDLYAVLPPLTASERPNDNLANVLRDRYQFDLLYYGALLKYWPQLSPDACNMALAEPARISETYPALDTDPDLLRARFSGERTIADAALRWRAAASKGGRASTAVTIATVGVTPDSVRMRVAIRNVFDWIPTNTNVAASSARFEIDAALLSEANAAASSPEARQGGLVPVAATKRHTSSHGPRSKIAIDWFTSRRIARDSVAFAIARESSTRGTSAAMRAIPFAFLTVYADGHYEASADWHEDDRVGFSSVIEELSDVVTPAIESINAMGAAAFPIGGTLAPIGAGTSLGAITVSAFWPHALTAMAFRETKDRFRAYEKAGIVGIRGLQQQGAYVFSFRKGVVAYDPRLAERAEAGAHMIVGADGISRAARGASASNQYAWLTDPIVAARWATSFHGRTVRIHHRATDLRVEIVGADSLAEFELIRRYVFSFLDGLLSGPNRIKTLEKTTVGLPEREIASETTAASRRLRRLQERDPTLYDLKKYDPTATVYSVLCQSGRQPHVYNEAESKLLSARRRAALVKYWNFTDNVPAYYECPDPKYPYLSFRSGQHPLGFCLPCCKKTRPAEGSRAALVNEGCLAQRGTFHESAEAEAESAMSRHVLTYGKAVPPGRLSDPPREVGEGLFLDTLPAPYRLQMIGIEQSAPAIPAAGYAYSLAYALGIGDESATDVLSELANAAARMVDTYHVLGHGAGASFASAGELAEAIRGAFVRREDALSPFGPGGIAFEASEAILAELARYAYGVETVVLTDVDGLGNVSLDASPEAASAIVNAPSVRVAILVSGPMGVYPLAALDPKFYLRVAPDSRWMAARRTFDTLVVPERDRGAEDDEYVVDTVAVAVKDALAYSIGTKSSPSAGHLLDLAAVMRIFPREARRGTS